MLVDVHCHLNFPQFDKDREKIIKQCLAEKIYLINVGCNYYSSKKAVEIAKKNKGVFAAVGIHPQEAEKENFSEENFLELATQEEVVAIGEIGLDYYSSVDKNKQKELLEKQIDFALKLNKPIIFHCRSEKDDKNYQAHQDLLKIIEKKKVKKGEIHCFDCQNLTILEKFLENDFYIGFTGLIIYSNKLDKIIAKAPLNRLLIETDSPFLSPLRQEKRNTPLNLKFIAQKISSIKGIGFEKIAKATFENGQKLFKLKI